MDRIQPSFGLYAAYPCNCWLVEADAVRRRYRELVAAADERRQVD